MTLSVLLRMASWYIEFVMYLVRISRHSLKFVVHINLSSCVHSILSRHLLFAILHKLGGLLCKTVIDIHVVDECC